jgi:hypothetical protein
MKKVLFAVSLTVNAIFALLIALALGAKPKTLSSLSFYRPEESVSAACVISLPGQNASFSFGTAEIILPKGAACSLQYSLFLDGGQLNIAGDPLYDHEIVSVERSGFGIVIRALAGGHCLLQSVTGEGIKNLALITVTETE